MFGTSRALSLRRGQIEEIAVATWGALLGDFLLFGQVELVSRVDLGKPNW